MVLSCGKFALDLSCPRIMGIVNVTPDSFSDGGRHFSPQAAIAAALRMIEEGADMLDIGAESTRPGAAPVGVQEELDRIMPVIEGLKGAPVPLSVDTYKPEVMQRALAAGADMVNDINALQEPGALAAVAAGKAAVCLMHKQGDAQTMQRAPMYGNVVAEVKAFLQERMAAAEAAGIARERIVVDPGFGFGKTLAHNLMLLKHVGDFRSLGVPVLAGLSRKSMLGAITGKDVDERLPSSLAAAMLAAINGAGILRVHDVGAMADALKVFKAMNNVEQAA